MNKITLYCVFSFSIIIYSFLRWNRVKKVFVKFRFLKKSFLKKMKNHHPYQVHILSWYCRGAGTTKKLGASLITVGRLLQRPKIDLNKRFLPGPNTTTAWKLIPHRSKNSKNWNSPWWDPLHRFFENSFTIITFKLILLGKEVNTVGDLNACWF